MKQIYSKTIFIGPCGGGNIPTNGASNKNYYLLNYLKSKLGAMQCVDTEYWRKNPFLLLKLFLIILFNNRANYIVSANNKSAYRLLSVITSLPFSRRHIIYWVIGGTIAERISSGEYHKTPYSKVDWILVEGHGMKSLLGKCGLNNVIVVPNFKNFTFYPNNIKSKRNEPSLIKFVFLSRILPEKGTDLILDACETLMDEGNFIVDFYGPIDESYREYFISRVSHLSMVSYNGFLDLRNEKNYEILSNYDVMLFPTFWNGEGFPGAIIDAYIAGLPVIASDWSMNRELIEENVTGWIIPTSDLKALVNKMHYVLNNECVLGEMRTNSFKQAENYKIESVISDDLLEKIELI